MKKLCTYMYLTGALVLLPHRVFADGVHPAAPAKLTGGTYVFLLFASLLALLAVLLLVRRGKKANNRLLRAGMWLAFAGLVLTGTANAAGVWQSKVDLSIDHIHGMGFSADGERLLLAAHDGLRVYSGGSWSEGNGNKHDYMGFSMTDSGFYASGHPVPGSGLKDPLGLVHSGDEGKSLHMLEFYGEIDFHLVAAGYGSHRIYVYNPAPQAKLKGIGLYYTDNDGQEWAKSRLPGIGGELSAIAVHPEQRDTLAIGTTTGLYLSADGGNTAVAALSGTQITSLAYGRDGTLYAGTYSSGKAGLIRIAGNGGGEATGGVQPAGVKLPLLERDAVAYVAVNPVNTKELAFASFNLQLYRSVDGGAEWKHIGEAGKLQ
ncbi:MAG: hypothetical protein K0R57_5748 [Paenibacillaceae bacterium]|nr:hypothetical protein [Paenibacillaceae bacterium]